MEDSGNSFIQEIANTKGQGVFLYPFSLLQIRRQVNQSIVKLGLGNQANNYLSMYAEVKNEGFKGFFKGCFTNIIYSSLNGLFISSLIQGNQQTRSDKIGDLFKFLSLNTVGNALLYPFLFSSNQLACNIGKQDAQGQVVYKYQNMRDVFQQTKAQFGTQGLYRGLSLHMVGNFIPFIPLYIFAKDQQFSQLVIGSSLLLFLQYPIETLRLRLIIQPNQDMSFKGIYNFYQNILKTESPRSLFSGCLPTYVTYALVISFFETVFQQIKSRPKEE